MVENNDYVWIRSDGKVYGLKTRKICLICKHCTDIFWDYTHGPYMVICEESEKTCNSESNLPEETNLGTECNLFEIEDGVMTVSEYERKRQAKEMEDFYNFINSKEWKEWPISTDSER